MSDQQAFAVSIRAHQENSTNDDVARDVQIPLIDDDGKAFRHLTVRGPSSAQMAFMLSVIETSEENIEVAGETIAFFKSLLNEDDRRFVSGLVRKRLFGLEEMAQIFEYCVQEWSANPIEPPSGSYPSQQPLGSPSMPPQQNTETTTSAFGQTDSAPSYSQGSERMPSLAPSQNQEQRQPWRG